MEYFDAFFTKDLHVTSLNSSKGSSIHKFSYRPMDSVTDESIIYGASIDDCPPENRVFDDRICDEPYCGSMQKSIAAIESSSCFLNYPENRESCRNRFVGCRSACDSIRKGWMGHYLNKGYFNIGDSNYDTWQSNLTENSIIGYGKCDAEFIGEVGTGNNMCRNSLAKGSNGIIHRGTAEQLFCSTGFHGTSPFEKCEKLKGRELLTCVEKLENMTPLVDDVNNYSNGKKLDWMKSSIGTNYTESIPTKNSYQWKFHDKTHNFTSSYSNYLLTIG